MPRRAIGGDGYLIAAVNARHASAVNLSTGPLRSSHRAPRLLWQQVYDDVMSDIRSGALAVDDRLPNELEMAEQYGVSRDVIRRAKEELAGEGWLIVLHGRGTFVARPAPRDDH
jgi:GntR family transcriptional regulator